MQPQRQPQPLAPLTRTYDEAFDLMVEARNYLAHIEPRERRRTDPGANLRISCESMRVTSRLTQVMAWLMLQRAVQNGELSPEEASSEPNRLSGQAVCLDVDAAVDSLPPGLCSLLDRSYRLYVRVSRLDEMVFARLH